MADRVRPPDERQVEEALRDLGARLAYPPTPDLARLVSARLAAGTPQRSRWAALLALSTPRRLALALVLLLALAGAVLALSPDARNAIAGRLGVPGITITYLTPTLPPPTATAPGTPTSTAAPPPSATITATAPAAGTPPTSVASPTAVPPTGTPTPVNIRPSLGQLVTIDEARARVSFPVLVPTLPDLGPPDEIYFGEPPLGGQVSFIWRARPGLPPVAGTDVGLLLTQFRGDLAPSFGQKGIDGATRVELVRVNGEDGIWIEGNPHRFSYVSPGGQYTLETTRLAGNVLLWERDGVTFRLEGARTLEEALRIATSLR